MRAAILTIGVLVALTFVSGCGSGGASSTATSTIPTTATSTIPAAGSPKVDKAPRYAAPTAAAPVRSGLVNVAYRDITIQPDTLRVKVGSTIRWTNYDSVEHNVTSQNGVERFASKDFGEGGTFEIKANKPGVIHYLCTIHPTSMNGTIEVVK
jgi:plastocyanin